MSDFMKNKNCGKSNPLVSSSSAALNLSAGVFFAAKTCALHTMAKRSKIGATHPLSLRFHAASAQPQVGLVRLAVADVQVHPDRLEHLLDLVLVELAVAVLVEVAEDRAPLLHLKKLRSLTSRMDSCPLVSSWAALYICEQFSRLKLLGA